MRVEQGDSRVVLKALAAASVDSCVTDPPYALRFMGKGWDSGATAHDPAFWAEVYRVLKPGAHLVAFAATRTYHRMACAIEDAGFEIRDQIGWAYGSGFPKSHNVAKAIDAALGAEPIVIADGATVRRMRPGADQAAGSTWEKLEDRTHRETRAATAEAEPWEGWGTALKPAWEPICLARKLPTGTVAANVMTFGTGALDIDGCRVALDEGEVKTGGFGNGQIGMAVTGIGEGLAAGVKWQERIEGRWPANLCHDGSGEVLALFPAAEGRSPARFFYAGKAGPLDRWGTRHPTVKPVDLMRWLVRLVTPPGGLVLDPFAGSGNTGIACFAEGLEALLIEREAEYVADIRERIAFYEGEGRHSLEIKARHGKPARPAPLLLGGEIPAGSGALAIVPLPILCRRDYVTPAQRALVLRGDETKAPAALPLSARFDRVEALQRSLLFDLWDAQAPGERLAGEPGNVGDVEAA